MKQRISPNMFKNVIKCEGTEKAVEDNHLVEIGFLDVKVDMAGSALLLETFSVSAISSHCRLRFSLYLLSAHYCPSLPPLSPRLLWRHQS